MTKQWKREDVTTALLCQTINTHGMEALDRLAGLGIPRKVLLAAVERDTLGGWITYGVSPWRPFLHARAIHALDTGLFNAGPSNIKEEPMNTAESTASDQRRWHEVTIVTHEPATEEGPVGISRRTVNGDDRWVAAALRAYANDIDPPIPPRPAHPTHRGVSHAAA